MMIGTHDNPDAHLGLCHFLPYVGPEYAQATQRLLVLGESHYEPRHLGIPERELTRRVVGDALERRQQHRFLTSVASAVTGTFTPPGTFWPQVAFYNFVQEFAGSGPRQRPREGSWADAVPAFCRVLGVLRPDLVLICGRQLWQHVARQPAISDHPEVAANDERTRSRVFYGDGDWSCVGGMIHHPASFGFRALEWYPRVRRYKDRATAHAANRSTSCGVADE
jgi:hypothetical protein